MGKPKVEFRVKIMNLGCAHAPRQTFQSDIPLPLHMVLFIFFITEVFKPQSRSQRRTVCHLNLNLFKLLGPVRKDGVGECMWWWNYQLVYDCQIQQIKIHNTQFNSNVREITNALFSRVCLKYCSKKFFLCICTSS